MAGGSQSSEKSLTLQALTKTLDGEALTAKDNPHLRSAQRSQPT